MIDFDTMVEEGARYLEQHRRCAKHHVEHTGSNCYLLDFYTELGEVEKGKELINYLLSLIVRDGEASVFYPGLFNKMNMSSNVIDSGSAVDAIARFVLRNQGAFTAQERAHITARLREVVESYLANAAREKQVTNQRLWGLTGVASYACLAGEEAKYQELARASIERAFDDSTLDGFFRYYPGAAKLGVPAGYDGITSFYQSRHSAFIRYALAELGMERAPYAERLAQADRALLAMYRADGIKDLRLECKRWYWQSPYEVASHGFDAYALAHSALPEAVPALHNVLYQIRDHFSRGYLHSDHGPDINFQCPIFWTAHLGWMLRTPDIHARFARADALAPFSYTFKGKEAFAHTTPAGRTLINARWQARNPSVGIYENGLAGRTFWSSQLPRLPQALGFSLRETANHAWYALRGLNIREAVVRVWRCIRELIVMLLPRYSEAYGRVENIEYRMANNVLTVSGMVTLASKYGTLHKAAKPFSIELPL